MAAQRDEIAYFIDVDSIGFKGSIPLLQTFPYEHAGKTKFSPGWLARMMIQSTASLRTLLRPVSHFYKLEPPKNRLSVYNLGIGSSLNAFHSLRYQMSRYHLISVRYLNDDGPFVWQDIPSLLFTDHYNV